MEGYPIGNGRLGGMVCGTAECERVALNHEWLYKGVYRDRKIIKPTADSLKIVRDLIKNGEYEKATRLANEYFAPTGGKSKIRQRLDPYQPAGDLYISEFVENTDIIEYGRSLDLCTAVQKTEYKTPKGKFTRKIFAMYPLGIIAAEITSEGTELDAVIKLDRVQDKDCVLEFSGRSLGQDVSELEMRGIFYTGIDFTVTARVIACGKMAISGNHVNIKGGNRAVILLDIKTSISDYDSQIGFGECDFDVLLNEHIKNWQKAYNTCSVEIRSECINNYTGERIEMLKKGEDCTLPVLYFNYGRYLLLSSAGGLPPHLQGIWNDKLDPPWDSDFHLNINLQMNYWISEISGLSETTEALFSFAERLIPSSKIAARELFGCRGVFFPLQTDAWNISTPESHGWAVWIGAAAWLALHFMEHYEYTGDIEFLKNRAYPFFKECAEFYEDYLFLGEDGLYVISPSQSPENRFKDGGDPVSLCHNCASDIELCEMVLKFAITAAEILNIDAPKIKIWNNILEKLPKLKIGPDGELMEYPENFELPEPGHRHFAHLIGVFPARTITEEKCPELFEAARRALELRLSYGGGHTGWSRAWVSCFYAEFGDAEKAFEHLKALICDFSTASLLDLHPPRIFQIDGNFGGAAAVCNMLIRSDIEKTELLPAIPKEWGSGEAKGFCAKGGFVFDFSWENGAVCKIKVFSKNGGNCRIKCNRFAENLKAQSRDGIFEIFTNAGETTYIW